MFSLYDAALFLGIFRGWGPRRVYDPHSGTGTGTNCPPLAGTVMVTGRFCMLGAEHLPVPGGDSPVAIHNIEHLTPIDSIFHSPNPNSYIQLPRCANSYIC